MDADDQFMQRVRETYESLKEECRQTPPIGPFSNQEELEAESQSLSQETAVIG